MTAYFKTGSFNVGKYGLSWHKEEKGIPAIVDGDTVTDAMAKAKMLEVTPVNAPVYFENPLNGKKIKAGKDQLVLTGVPWNKNGIQNLDRQVSWYNGISNKQYAELLDPLSQTWPVAGVLHAGPLGQVMAIQLELDPFDVAGMELEKHTTFLLVAEDRKSGHKHFHITTIRVVCQNTYNASVAGVKSLPNGKDSHSMLAFRVALEQAAIDSRRKHVHELNQMFAAKVTKEEGDKLANILFPMPKRPQFLDLMEKAREVNFEDSATQDVVAFANDKEYKVVRDYNAAMDRQESYVKGFFTRLNQFNDEFSYAANTKYALWQAATDCLKPSSDLFGRTEEDTAMYKLFFGGDRMKQLDSAYAYLTK